MQFVWRSFVAAGARGALLADIPTDWLEHRGGRMQEIATLPPLDGALAMAAP
jgi:hypothetical protein